MDVQPASWTKVGKRASEDDRSSTMISFARVSQALKYDPKKKHTHELDPRSRIQCDSLRHTVVAFSREVFIFGGSLLTHFIPSASWPRGLLHLARYSAYYCQDYDFSLRFYMKTCLRVATLRSTKFHRRLLAHS